MDRQELLFRLTCASRRIASRAAYAIRPPQWNRGTIVRLLDRRAGPLVARAIDAARRGDYLAAHRALASHIENRPSRWPLQAARRRALVDDILAAFPYAADTARRRADRILDGRHDLLGYRDVDVGTPPVWDRDAVHARHAPSDHWTAIPYLDPAIGDHKVIWETNRHQYFCELGAAWWLRGDRRYRDEFVAQLGDWLARNPPLHGINWSSMLELAFRTLSWTWAVEFFCDGAEADSTPWLVDLLIALDRQLTHVAHNLSRYFSPNTHLTGEALALYAVSTAFPELRASRARASEGRDVLLREAARQVRPDGGHAELSAHYHRYSTDFYLLALMVARASGDPAATAFEDASRRQAIYLRTIADDSGRLPLIGDDDGGRLFGFGERGAADASVSLSVAASVLSDASLAVGPPSQETFWILGSRPTASSSGAPARWPSRHLRDSGYLVSRSPDGGHLIFDAGPHGFLNGGHAHSDALSLVLTVNGEPLLVDPGTATYTMDAAMRDRFRSSRMHNTLVLEDRDHAATAGPFHWSTRADARFLVARTEADWDFAVGTHDAYGTRRHLRAVLSVHDVGWLVVDRVATDRPVTATTWWHLDPAWRGVIRDGTVGLAHASGARLALATTAAEIAFVTDPQLSAVAPEYGRVERSTALQATQKAASTFVIATFIPSSAALSEPLAIVHGLARPMSDEWESRAFGVHAGHRELHLEVAFPRTPQAQLDRWPQPCIEELHVCVE
jgi:hypothetical protein